MYLNIILTLIFLALVFIGLTFYILIILVKREDTKDRIKSKENREYQKSINTKMVELHEEILDELKRWRT